MATAAQENQLSVARVEDDRRDTFSFERKGDEFPMVDVAFVLRSLHGRTRIVTDGPYKNEMSPGSKTSFRQRPENSPKMILETAVNEEKKLELATKLAELLFKISETQNVSEQE